MPSKHATVSCPHCGMETRSNNLKRHMQRMHQEVAPTIPEVAPTMKRVQIDEGEFSGLILPSEEDVWAYESGAKTTQDIWASY